jgi:hypothetical protein
METTGQAVRSTWESVGWLGLLVHNLLQPKKYRKTRLSQLLKLPWLDEVEGLDADQKAVMLKMLKANTTWIEKRFGVKFKHRDE